METAYQNEKEVFEYVWMDIKYLVNLTKMEQYRLDAQENVSVERKVYRIIMTEADAKTIFDPTIDKVCVPDRPDNREGNEKKRKRF